MQIREIQCAYMCILYVCMYIYIIIYIRIASWNSRNCKRFWPSFRPSSLEKDSNSNSTFPGISQGFKPCRAPISAKSFRTLLVAHDDPAMGVRTVRRLRSSSSDSEGLCYLGRMVRIGFHWLHFIIWRWLSIGFRFFDSVWLCFDSIWWSIF